jgi:citrate synthase
LGFYLHGFGGFSGAVGLLRHGDGAEQCQRHHQFGGAFYLKHNKAIFTRGDATDSNQKVEHHRTIFGEIDRALLQLPSDKVQSAESSANG